MANPPKLLSGRVPVVPLDQLSNTRYQFLGLNEAEPNLGNGVANSILTIKTDGTRIWANTINVTTANFSGNVVGTTFYGNFVGNITANANANAFISAPGANTEVLFNNQGNIGANANLTFDVSQALLTTGNLSVLGQVSAQFGSFSETVSANNITVGNQISAATGSFANVSVSANIAGGNLAVTGLITATGNITGGNIDAANLIYSAGNVSAAGNILGGNILATNMVSATGNIFGNYITAAQNVAVLGNKITSGTSTGIVFSPGNTSLFSSNLIIDGGYIYSINGDPEIKLSYNGEIGSVGIFNNLYLGANGTGNLTVPGTSNLWGQVYSNSTITAAGNLTANSVTANLEIVATGNITGGNIITSGFVTATGNIQSSANLVAPRVVTSNIATNNNSLTISTDADFNINIHPSGNGTVDLNDHRITNLGTPSLPDDAVTKEYVDTQTSTGLHIHQPVKWLETGNLTATYANGGTSVTVDTISGNKTLTFTTSPGLAVDDLIVFTNSFNGITGGTPYFVYSTNGTNQVTLKATILGVEITTLTNGGPGLAQAGLVNSGVGATLTNAGANAAFVPSGSNVAASVNDRILVINQANGAFNGVYSVTTVGNAIAQWVFTRSTDEDTYDPANTSAASAGDYVLVTDGDSSGDSYVLTDPTGPIVFGTSNIQFTLFSSVPSYTGANGVAVTGLTISANVDNITTAITNGNIVVKDSAVFTTPNIGAATGISLSVTGNLAANNLSLTTSLSGNIANFAGNVSAGNLISLGIVSASGNVSGNNLYISNESNLAGNLHALGNSHFGQPLTFAASGANIQYAGTANSYLQLIVQNKDNGAAASTDFVATADNGTDSDTFIDMGINSSAYNQAGYELTGPNDGYLYVYGNTTTGGGSLVLATYTAKDIVFATGGLANANLAAKFQHGNGLSVAGNVYAPWFIGNVGGNASNIIVQGPNTGVVFNDDSSANSTLGFTFDKSSNSVVVAGNLTANNLSATSNISGNNLNLTGALTSGNLNISNSNISTTGNITANYFLGNGSLLTGIVTSVSNIFNGNTNVRIDTANGNVAANVAGTANVLVLANTGAYVNGEVSVNGNVTGNYFYGNGYFLTGVSVDTTRIYNGNSNVRIDTTSGNIQANVAGTANVLTIANTGVYTTNVFANTVSASGNVTGAYFIGNGSQLTGVVNATVSNSPPSFPDQGDIWINSDTGIQYIYFTASGNSQWAEMEADVSFSSSTGGGNGNVDFTSINSNVLPSANVTYNLGNSTNRWNDIWLANSTIYLGAANISSQGPNLILPNVVVLGNVILDASSGNLDIPGEFTTNSDIVLSNTVSSNIVGAGNFLITQNNGKYVSINSQDYSQLYWTSNIANLDVGGNDSYAWVYVHQDGVYIETNPISGNQHQWTFRANGVIDTTYDLTTTGNVVVDYIESMSDVIANANVTASGNISATGNVLAGANIWANGNIYATTVFANLSACSFVYGNTVTANAELFLNANANLYFSYESDSPANLYTWIVSANTEGIYAVGGGNASGGGTTYEVANAYGNINGSNVNALFANVIGNVDAGAVSVSGNITANYYIGDGSALTGIPPGYSNANVDSYLPVYSGNISAGNISVTSAVAAATLSGNGAALTALTFGNITDITTANLTVDDIYLQGSTRLNVTSSGVSGYIFDQYGNSLNPTLYLTSGETVAFNLYHAGHPFLIQTSGGANYSNGLIHVTTSGVATTGASAQGQINGTLYWKVPYGISGQYRYICQAHAGMNGNIIINDANSGNIVSNVVVSTTGFMQLPVGNTAQRPSSPAAGMVRYNSQIGEPEWYDPAGNQWLKFSQAAQYNVDFLIVAGGGAGGGYDIGGGGGAGGLIASSTTVNPGTVYNVVVGAGGTVPGRAGQGGSGSNSSVFSNTAVGGGGGAAGNSGGNTVASPGGSGGGGSWSTTGGTGTVGQGYDGGAGVPTGGAASAGGGGGAGGVGIAGGVAGTSRGGAGGPGYTWTNGSTYAGGGGGGSDTSYNAPGGSSIGGSGGASGGGGTNGTASTGSGGGGGGGFGGQAGGTGGGGIVIVRYSGTQRASGGTVTSAGGYTYHTFTGSGTFTA